MKTLTAAIAGGLLAAGCATGPYYGDPGGYNHGYDGTGPIYYGPAFTVPTAGVGYTVIDHDNDRHWRRDRDQRREWRDLDDHLATPQPGVDYSNEYERQNLENRERLLRGQEPSGAGG